MRAQIEKFSKDAKEQIDSKDYKAALEIYKNAEPLISTGGTKEEFSVLHHNMATCYKHLNELFTAYDSYEKAQEISYKIDDPAKRNERVKKEELCIRQIVPTLLENKNIPMDERYIFLERELFRYQKSCMYTTLKLMEPDYMPSAFFSTLSAETDARENLKYFGYLEGVSSSFQELILAARVCKPN